MFRKRDIKRIVIINRNNRYRRSYSSFNRKIVNRKINNKQMESFQMIAKTFQGLEEVLAQELTALGANDLEIGRRMVSFSGDKEMCTRQTSACAQQSVS